MFVLLNIMFHAPMGGFQLELLIFISYFSPSSHSLLCFLSCRPFIVNTALSTGFVKCWVSFVSWHGQLTVGVQITQLQLSTAQARILKKLQHAKRPVENVALTTKDLQERKHNIEWDDGEKLEIKISNSKYL